MSVLIVVGLLHNPRIALHSFPDVIQDAVPPKTVGEKWLTAIYGIGTILALLVVPTAYATIYGAESYATIWVHVFAIAMIFNVVDLVLIDWLLICLLTPKWTIVPGTENPPAYNGYKDYGFHLVGFLKGVIFCVVLPTVVTCIAFAANLGS